MGPNKKDFGAKDFWVLPQEHDSNKKDFEVICSSIAELEQFLFGLAAFSGIRDLSKITVFKDFGSRLRAHNIWAWDLIFLFVR